MIYIALSKLAIQHWSHVRNTSARARARALNHAHSIRKMRASSTMIILIV